MRPSGAAKYAKTLVDGVEAQLADKADTSYVDSEVNAIQAQLNQFTRVEISEGDPVNPEPGVLYAVIPKPDMPVTDYLFRFDASQLYLADGAKVSSWSDISGNGHDLTQANAADQPTFLSAGLNGKPSVSFNNSHLDKAGFSLDNVNEATVFLVVDFDGTASQSLFSINNGAIDHAFGLRTSGSTQSFDVCINNWNVNGARTPMSTDPRVYVSHYDGARSKMYENGVVADDRSIAESSIGAHSLLRLGRHGDDGHPYNGKISEVVYFPRALSEAEVGQVNTYLLNKWGF